MLNFKIEDNKATSYKQSMMDDIKPTDGADKHQVISVRKAIEALYYNRYLKKVMKSLMLDSVTTQS